MNYCTYFDFNYLDRGLALYESMVRHCQPFHLWVLALCERTKTTLERLDLPHVTVVGMGDFENPELRAAKATRTVREYYWTCTGSWMLHVFEHWMPQSLSYLDADCFFFGSPRSLFREVDGLSVAITPHRFSPSHRHFVSNGIFNVGLVYVRPDEMGLGCLHEWSQQCLDWCYYRNENGKFADQKYLDVWPEKWGAHPIEHKGVDLAPWNQAEQYTYSLHNGCVYVDDDPLVFYHFHQRLSPAYRIEPFIWDALYKPYEQALEEARSKY